jgi:hypothetical protein
MQTWSDPILVAGSARVGPHVWSGALAHCASISGYRDLSPEERLGRSGHCRRSGARTAHDTGNHLVVPGRVGALTGKAARAGRCGTAQRLTRSPPPLDSTPDTATRSAGALEASGIRRSGACCGGQAGVSNQANQRRSRSLPTSAPSRDLSPTWLHDRGRSGLRRRTGSRRALGTPRMRGCENDIHVGRARSLDW